MSNSSFAGEKVEWAGNPTLSPDADARAETETESEEPSAYEQRYDADSDLAEGVDDETGAGSSDVLTGSDTGNGDAEFADEVS